MSHLGQQEVKVPKDRQSRRGDLLPDGRVCTTSDNEGVVHPNTVNVGAVAPEDGWSGSHTKKHP